MYRNRFFALLHLALPSEISSAGTDQSAASSSDPIAAQSRADFGSCINFNKCESSARDAMAMGFGREEEEEESFLSLSLSSSGYCYTCCASTNKKTIL